jgi:hypothetical protein
MDNEQLDNEQLERLREIAFFLRVAPRNRKDHAVAVEVLISMLSSLQESYARYAEILFRHEFTSSTQAAKKMDNDQFPLMVVDLKYESFGAALAIDYISESKYDSFMKGRSLTWKKQSFLNFKEDVLDTDLNSIENRNNIKSKFTDDERRAIYGPIFRSIHRATDYRIIVKPTNNGRERQLRDLPDAIKGEITPAAEDKTQQKPKTRFVKGYLEVDESDQIISKKSIRKILATTPVPLEGLPYFTSKISLPGDITIHLRELIEVDVKQDEEGFQLMYEPLDINVWGDTREDAEEAFNFTFISLFETYGKEDDENLTEEAQELKQSLLNHISTVEGGAQ